MRQLDCDFCGATAAGAYEVLPAELDPSPDEQVRVVLCDDCRRTLDGVLDPLLARLGAAGAADGGTAPGPEPSSASGSSSAPSPGTPGGSDPTDDPDAEGDAQANARSGNPSLPADDAVIIGDEAGDADESGGDDGDGGATPDASDADATPSDAPDGEPDHFRQVMRLLGNREFPVERADVVEIAGSAYGVDTDQADRIVDYAVEQDVLEEEDGRLWKA